MKPKKNIKEELEKLYSLYNKRIYVKPDPLQFLYSYKENKDREIAGIIASSLAYGRVGQIIESVSSVLDIMNPRPYIFLTKSNGKLIRNAFKGFVHRFANQDHIAALLIGIKRIIEKFGSINECFVSGMSEGIISGMNFLAKQLCMGAEDIKPHHLIPLPEKGSACKRMNLFLRWMVRKDRVDPGGWEGVSASELIVPLDTHMHRIAIAIDFTKRKSGSMNTATEITSEFAKIAPDDPVKYDFALTRFGIRKDMHISRLYSRILE